MPKILLTFIVVFFLINASGQKTEFKVSLNSGLFSFVGGYAKSTSYLIAYNNNNNSGITNNPFGKHEALCYGMSGNIQQLTKKRFLFGCDFGYEKLRSKVLIDEVVIPSNTNPVFYAAKGKEFLNFDFVNVFPYIGHRFKLERFFLDCIAGFDIGFCSKNLETTEETTANGTYKTSIDKKPIKVDIRPRIQFSLNYHKFGVYIGYSYGLGNYAAGYYDGKQESYSRMIRFGLTYKLK